MAILITLLMALVIAGFVWIGFVHLKDVRNNRNLLRGTIGRKGKRRGRIANRATMRK